MEIKNVIVIGASAGGIKAVTELISKIPENLPVALFVVIHMAKNSHPDVIIHQLQKKTSYHCTLSQDGEDIKAGYLYMAAPDQHLLVKPGLIRLIKGAHENRWRPAIDVLFRSAAVAYDSHVIGIILSGMMDDGTSGMSAIKRCGGICIVQEPAEAEFIDMPVNVLSNVNVDYRVPIADMGYIIDDIVSKPVTRVSSIPEDVKIEADITERMVSDIKVLSTIGTHSNFTCPDCGGGLWEIKNDAHRRYRCHTGHVYTEKALVDKQGEEMEESLWISIRMMEERRNLLLNILWRNQETGSIHVNGYQNKADTLSMHIERLKHLLLSISKTDNTDKSYL
ncbi:MAG: Protein-glutamate methylesterase [Mucilaginibacter sp.]|nr:Protein-glutamate methylesterase [Mucilaginibacter sp.]